MKSIPLKVQLGKLKWISNWAFVHNVQKTNVSFFLSSLKKTFSIIQHWQLFSLEQGSPTFWPFCPPWNQNLLGASPQEITFKKYYSNCSLWHIFLSVMNKCKNTFKYLINFHQILDRNSFILWLHYVQLFKLLWNLRGWRPPRGLSLLASFLQKKKKKARRKIDWRE
jgi:hypothetical protein